MPNRDQKHLCEGCRERKARFSYRGVVRADASHTLCFACFRSERDQMRARSLADCGDGVQAAASGAGRLGNRQPLDTGVRSTLSAAQRAHRLRMLFHLTKQGSRAGRPGSQEDQRGAQG